MSRAALIAAAVAAVAAAAGGSGWYLMHQSRPKLAIAAPAAADSAAPLMPPQPWPAPGTSSKRALTPRAESAAM